MSTETTLTQFDKQQYINLETYRKNGQAMQTPVWFLKECEILYVRTVANCGKVKRARNFPTVRVAPCDQRGGVLGEWVGGLAHLVDQAEAERVNKLLGRKYGLLKVAFEVMGKLNKRQYDTLAIQLVR